MKIKSILFPTDFSECNKAALEYASWFAVQSGATLHLVYVHDPREVGAVIGEGSYLFAEKWEEERARAQTQLKQVTAADSTIPCEHHFLLGIPDAEIVAYAIDHHIDLIVMASHGRSGLSRLLMGSVAESVMRKAPCPVLVVKQPDATISPASAAS